MAEVYKIVKNGQGLAGFMNPPGDPAHIYVIESYSSNRHNTQHTGSYSISTDDAWIPQAIRNQARDVLTESQPIASELWMRNVYGYFHGMWTPNGVKWSNVDQLVSKRPDGAPLDWHAAVVHIRRWFPDHEPRADMIADPGKGYGTWPCTKCGQRVQYEPRLDALAVRTESTGETGRAECPAFGKHTTGDRV